jgi:hypothetical protein
MTVRAAGGVRRHGWTVLERRRLWELVSGASGGVTVSVQAARSTTHSPIGWPMVCHPSTLRVVLWPGAGVR